MPAKKELKTGSTAPAFTLPDKDEKKTSLKDFRGRWVVVYFYPKDNTSGCTLEAKNFTDSATTFKRNMADILGISPDSPESHCRFTDKHGLGITLLSDVDHKVADKYGVWQLKKMAGREYYGIVRSTFLINPDGKIAALWSKVKVKDHVQEVLETLRHIKKDAASS